MKSIFQKFTNAVKLYRFGIFNIAFNKVFKNYFTYHNLILFAFDLQHQKPPKPATDKAVKVKRVEDAEDKTFKQFQQAFPAPEFLRRINQEKETAYIAVKEGEVVSYAWVTQQEMTLESINYTWQLQEDEIFIYACYVSLEHRGEKIHSLMLYERLQDYIQRGNYSTAYVAVLSTNKGSIKGVKRAGFKEVKRIRYLKFLGLEKRWGLG